LLSAPAPSLLSGLTALITWGAFFSELTVAFTACSFLPVVSFPVEVSITTGLVPFACLGRLS
jgi:hypothetical protein